MSADREIRVGDRVAVGSTTRYRHPGSTFGTVCAVQITTPPSTQDHLKVEINWDFGGRITYFAHEVELLEPV